MAGTANGISAGNAVPCHKVGIIHSGPSAVPARRLAATLALRGSIEPAVAAPAPVASERSPVAARRAFLEGGTGKSNESPERISGPSSPYILQSGRVIPAALITGIRPDLPDRKSTRRNSST